MTVAARERETYEAMWAISEYASVSPGEQLADVFVDCVQAHGGRRTWQADSVLDAGCGSGKGAIALRGRGFSVTLCDMTPAGLSLEAAGLPFHEVPLWEPLRRVVGWHDWVYCCDVMEHIPTPFTMLVAARLLEVARRGVFFSIALVPDQFGAMIGKPLHQSVQSFVEWRDQLATLGKVVEARDLLSSGIYLVAPK